MVAKDWKPGQFCWIELTTSDVKGAKAFYSELFDWKTKDDPLPSGEMYTMLSLGDDHVGGIYELNADQKSQGIPPNWLSYVAVDNVDNTTQKAKKLGAQLTLEPLDIPKDVGRISVLRDPTGATFALFQPKEHPGYAHLDNAPGSSAWNELLTDDAEAASKFYSELFGWSDEVMDMAQGQYHMMKLGDLMCGGIMQKPENMGDAPSNWMVYFSVADCDDSTRRAESLKGKLYVPPTDIPNVGRFSVVADAQGAVLALIKLAK